MFDVELTPEQEQEAARIADVLMAKAQVQVRQISRLLASKSDRDLLGETEFQIRNAVHRLGAEGIDAALAERKKRGTQVRALSARTASRTRGSTGIGNAR
jgi:hypothetical protein